MTEQQYKRWMLAKTRQYIWLIMRMDPNRVRVGFMTSFEGKHRDSCGACSKPDRQIYYRTDFIKNGWDCDLKVLENLIIHEVCHLKHDHHRNEFFSEYKRWSGDDFIDRWHNGMVDESGRYVPNVAGLPRGALIGM